MQVIKTLCLLLVWALATTSAHAQIPSAVGYTLGSGDMIRISVFGEPDLSFEQIQLNDAGTFSYPFLDTINAKDKSARDVEQILINGLRGSYLVDPKVTVSILEYRKFFVNGEVSLSGGYPFQPGMTLRKAVSLAGGFTDRASRSAFYIIRDIDTSRTPQKIGLDDPIMPGDIITIEQSFF